MNFSFLVLSFSLGQSSFPTIVTTPFSEPPEINLEWCVEDPETDEGETDESTEGFDSDDEWVDECNSQNEGMFDSFLLYRAAKSRI